MYRHPYQMEIDALYTRERIAGTMASCRGTLRPTVTAGAKPRSTVGLRRTMGGWLITIGQRLQGSRTPVPAR